MITAVLVCLPFLGLTADRPEPVWVDRDPEAMQPQVAIDSKHRIFVTYAAGNEIRCVVSLDGGGWFGPPTLVARVPKLALGMRRGPRIAASDQAVVITAVVHVDQESAAPPRSDVASPAMVVGDLVAWRSVDQGRTWTGPVRLNTVAESAREGLHALAARPDGTFFCVWLDLRLGAMALFGARSTDEGSTWGPDHEVHRSPEKAICPCCHPSLAFAPDGGLLVMWRDDVQGARDMYLRRSGDAGDSFGPATKLGLRTWIYGQCPMDGGAIAAGPEGEVVTAWMRAGEVWLANPVGPERSLGPGVQPWVAAAPGGVASVWLIRRLGPLAALIPDRDESLTLAPMANDPVVASAPAGRGPVLAAWESAAENDRGIAVQVLIPEAPAR